MLFTAFLRGEATFWAHSLHKALMCMAVAAVWLGYETYLRPLEGRRLVTLLLPFSFFIFVAQEPLLTMIKRVGLHVLGSSDAAMLFVYFFAPLLTLAIVVAVAAVVAPLPADALRVAHGRARRRPDARRAEGGAPGVSRRRRHRRHHHRLRRRRTRPLRRGHRRTRRGLLSTLPAAPLTSPERPPPA